MLYFRYFIVIQANILQTAVMPIYSNTLFLIRGSFGVFGYSQSNNQSTFLFAAEQQNT